MTRFRHWFRGIWGPVEVELVDDRPIIPDEEPRKPQSTSERKARGVRTRIQREEIEHALDRMVFRATRQWGESNPDEREKREELYRLVNVIHVLRTELQSVVSDGEMAAAEEQARAKRPSDNRA